MAEQTTIRNFPRNPYNTRKVNWRLLLSPCCMHRRDVVATCLQNTNNNTTLTAVVSVLRALFASYHTPQGRHSTGRPVLWMWGERKTDAGNRNGLDLGFVDRCRMTDARGEQRGATWRCAWPPVPWSPMLKNCRACASSGGRPASARSSAAPCSSHTCGRPMVGRPDPVMVSITRLDERARRGKIKGV